jgi:hypothetical protein
MAAADPPGCHASARPALLLRMVAGLLRWRRRLAEQSQANSGDHAKMANGIRKFRGVTGRFRDPVFLDDIPLPGWVALIVQEREIETPVELCVKFIKGEVIKDMESASPTDWGPTARDAALHAYNVICRGPGFSLAEVMTGDEHEAVLEAVTPFFWRG